MSFDRGAVVLTDLEPVVGHEQRGTRPCVIVSDPAAASSQRFGMIAVVPVTRTPGEGSLYPTVLPGRSGLTARSYALVDHVRAIDKQRIRRKYGRITDSELAKIDQGLKSFLGLDRNPNVTLPAGPS